MLSIIKGNIFDSPADTLVNPVNCFGVMGKGLALEFKNRFPEMYEYYRVSCKAGMLKPGGLIIYPEKDKSIICLATKYHWKDSSHYSFILSGLSEILKIHEEHPIKHIAMPAIGCGLGGLDYKVLEDMMMGMSRLFETIGLRIDLYPPM